jgi:hypothetical protein
MSKLTLSLIITSCVLAALGGLLFWWVLSLRDDLSVSQHELETTRKNLTAQLSAQRLGEDSRCQVRLTAMDKGHQLTMAMCEAKTQSAVNKCKLREEMRDDPSKVVETFKEFLGLGDPDPDPSPGNSNQPSP